jgi:protein-tyrosine-phosphatase
MAMGLWQNKVKSDPHWQVESAGTWSIKGVPAAENSIIVSARRGIDLRGHRSRGISREMLVHFNLILVMESGQKEALSVEFPDMRSKVFLISEMVGEQYDIKDPMGEPLEDFEATAEEFEQIFNQGYARIVQLASG